MSYSSNHVNIILISFFAILGLASGNNPEEQENKRVENRISVPAIPSILVDRRSSKIPAAWLYDSWNTQLINPYHIPIEDFMDTILIQLSTNSECGFTMPVEGKITSRFGYRHYRYHKGLDLDLVTGDPVHAAFDGIIRIARYSSSFGYVVVIRHWNGLETLYAHMSRLLVKPGDEVESGQIIGKGGSTGRSTGSHLHWEVRYKGLPFNPQKLINLETGKSDRKYLLLSPLDFKYFIPQSIRTLYSYNPDY